MPTKFVFLLAGVSLLIAQPSLANNVGENVAWQFLTPADKASLMYLEEVRLRAKNGFYSAPIYNTYINDQFNCSVNSTALANDSASSVVANSPSTNGHDTNATGNQNDTTFGTAGLRENSTGTNAQDNSGEVLARASGETSTSVRGDHFQALNTEQSNSGSQSSTINGSSACQYGAVD